MPTSVVATNNESFHLWQLHADSSREVSPSIEFNEIRNDLGNGYRSSVLYGADTGTRSWTISLPTLAGNDIPVPTVTGVNGETVSREQYIWDLYCETRITGKPFVYTCPRDSQYYLVDFVNSKLTYEKEFRNALYSTGVEIRQVREAGVSVFDPSVFENTYDDFDYYNSTTHNSGLSTWQNARVGSSGFLASGDVVFSSNPQNGFNTVRLSGTSSTGKLVADGIPSAAAPTDVIIAMKMREDTFSNACGLFGNIIGTASGTKWANPSHTGLEYTLNGTSYAVTDMQAPMNTWGVCHFRTTVANPFTATQFGQNGSTAGTFALADLGELYIFGSPISQPDARRLIEHLVIKFDV